MQTCKAYIAFLNDPAGPFWLVFKGMEAWTAEKRKMAFYAAWSLIGDLYVRVIRHFKGWPWRLATLVNVEASVEEKEQVVHDFFQASACCLDSCFSSKRKAMVHDAADLQSPRTC